jgi:SAM-dependent methyltransferase
MAVAEQAVPRVAEGKRLPRLIESARSVGLLQGGREYTHRCHTLFDSVDFRGKNVLEIGCGKGLMSLWAKIQGASHVIGLEPMADGCYDSPQCFKDFAKMANDLALENTEMLPLKLEDYRPQMKFDIVLSLASINHLDEHSCIELKNSKEAYNRYVQTFQHVRDLMANDGTLFIADATNRSFFSDLHLRNPFNPDIEWFKHQTPQVWAQLLSECGFGYPRISWLSQPLLTFLGIGTVPRAVSYFSSSAFRLQMQCVSRPRQDAGSRVLSI